MFFQEHCVSLHGHFYLAVGLQNRVSHVKYSSRAQNTAAVFEGSTEGASCTNYHQE